MNDCQYCEPDDSKCPGPGLCHCGCGGKTNRHQHANRYRHIRVGDFCKYLQGHRFSFPDQKKPPLTMAQIKELGG